MLTSLFSDHDDYQTASVLAGFLATGLAAVYSLARLGFAFRLVPVLVLLGISYFLVFAPLTTHFLTRRLLPRAEAEWLRSVAFGAVLALLIVVGAGALPPTIGQPIGMGIALTGAVLAGTTTLRWLRAGTRWSTLLMFLVGAALIAQVIGLVWGSGYLNPLFREQIIQGIIKNGTLDTLYHSAIGEMIVTYGVPSTGLDGIPFLYYHTGSHAMIGWLGQIAGLSALEAYQAGYPTVVIPFYLYALLTCMIDIRSLGKSQLTHALRNDSIFWIVFVLILWSGINPITFNLRLLSESYTVSLGLMFLMISLTLRAFREEKAVDSLDLPSGKILIILLLSFLLALTGLAKQSVMLALWAAVLYGFIRLRLYRRWGNLLAIFATLILTGVAIAITYPRGFQSAEVSGFSIWSLTFGQHPFIWFMLYYLWAYLYILARLAILGIKTFDDLLHAFSGKQLLDVELLIVLLAASIVPAFVFDLDFNGYYFTDVPVVIGMALLLGMLTKFQEEFRLPGLSQSLFKRDAILANWAVAILLVWMTGAIVVRLGKDSLNTVRDMLQTQARFSNLPADGSGISRSEVVMGWVRSADFGAVSRWAASHESYLSSQSGYAVMTTLEELHYLPVSVRRESILFIPQTNRAYWDFFPEDSNTLWRFQSLLAPAFSGLAQLEGIPPGETWNEFGFQAYDLPFDDQALTTDDQAGLCEAALARGFSRVIVFDVNEKGDPAITHIPCP